MRKILTALAGIVLLSQAAYAAGDPRPIGTFGDWSAYTFSDSGNKVCFMSAKPTTEKGNYTKRGEVMLFVTHWPDAQTKNVVSISTGYSYRNGSDATLTIDGKDFKMATEGETAWSKNQAADDAITSAIRQGAGLTVVGYSGRGTKTTDTYSLKGSADAYDAISKECNFQ